MFEIVRIIGQMRCDGSHVVAVAVGEHKVRFVSDQGLHRFFEGDVDGLVAVLATQHMCAEGFKNCVK